MATLYVTQYKQVARDSMGGVMPFPMEPSLGTITVPIEPGSKASVPFVGGTHFVMLVADETCHVVFGEADDLEAKGSDLLIIAGSVAAYFGVTAGMRVAVIMEA